MIKPAIVFMLVVSVLNSCSTSGGGRYFGKTVAPSDNVLRYVSGSEPASLDPQMSTGQPEARLYMALYDGLVENDPKDQSPIPAIAKSWEISPKVDEFIFHLRDNAKWSDGTPITAKDFVYSFRRGFTPDTISPTADVGYFVKYAQAFNEHRVFVRKNGQFFLEKDFGGTASDTPAPFGPETEFHKLIHQPDKLTLDGDEKKRAKQIDADPKLKAAIDGAEFVPINAEDIGLEALDDLTLRITLKQTAPFFLGVLTHQFFRLVPEKAVKQWGKQWVRPEHILTCGAFRVKEYRPYDALILERDPNYWDAANVHLDRIEFYPVEENATILNLYKSGGIDAFLNHSVLASWIDDIRQYKDEYMNFPENATAYYSMNLSKPPFDNPKIRKAFQLAFDRVALSNFRKVTRPLYDITPNGTYPAYDKAREKVSEEMRVKSGVSPEVWEKREKFDPDQARKLMAEAGFPVEKSGNGYACPKFPTDQVAVSYNTNETNKAIAEFAQAQWKENLGITVPLKNMEFQTFLADRKALQYNGFAQSLWSGDYMDPYTFLSLHYGKINNGGAGFYDPAYDKMLDDANTELDQAARYEKLARAEFYLMEKLPSIPLTVNATNWMKKPYVKGMYPNPGTLIAWKFVYIERDPSKWDHDVDDIMKQPDQQYDKQMQELTSTQKAAK